MRNRRIPRGKSRTLCEEQEICEEQDHIEDNGTSSCLTCEKRRRQVASFAGVLADLDDTILNIHKFGIRPQKPWTRSHSRSNQAKTRSQSGNKWQLLVWPVKGGKLK